MGAARRDMSEIRPSISPPITNSCFFGVHNDRPPGGGGGVKLGISVKNNGVVKFRKFMK